MRIETGVSENVVAAQAASTNRHNTFQRLDSLIRYITDKLPQPPLPSLPFGEEVFQKLQLFPVCTVGGPPGSGKSKNVPVSLLQALINHYPQEQHGIADIMELEEAQNTLYAHVIETYPSLEPCFCI